MEQEIISSHKFTLLLLLLHRPTNSADHFPGFSWPSGDILTIRSANWNIYHCVPKITLSWKWCLNCDKTRAALPPNGECLIFQSRWIWDTCTAPCTQTQFVVHHSFMHFPALWSIELQLNPFIHLFHQCLPPPIQSLLINQLPTRDWNTVIVPALFPCCLPVQRALKWHCVPLCSIA